MFLVIGCGYLGEKVADLLHFSGTPVVAITHSSESAARLAKLKEYEVVSCDLTNPDSLQELSSRYEISAALHCASTGRGGSEQAKAIYQGGSENFRAVFPDATLHFVSSTSVYPQTDGSKVTEETLELSQSPTGLALQSGEAVAIASGGFAARLSGIYGPGRSHVLKNFLQGTATIEGNDAQGRLLNQIHRDDAASALLRLIKTASAGLYNITDSTPMTQRECFTHLAERFHRAIPSVTAPNTQRKRAWTHKRVNNSKLCAVPWTPMYPSYFHALEEDAELVPSILAQLTNHANS